MYSRPTASRQLAPPLNPAFAIPLVINSAFFPASTRAILTTRYDPDGDGLGSVIFSKRFEDTGPRILSSERDYYRAVLGLKAELGGSWSLDGYYSYGRNDNRETLDNAVSLSRVIQGLTIDPVTGACTDPSNGCVAVNIFGDGNISPAAQEFIRVVGLANEYASVQHNAALVATGDLFSWSQGTAQASGGIEFRRNVATATADPALATGDALGFSSFAGAQGAVDLYEVFAEMLVPLVEDKPFVDRLEVEFGGRYSNYSTAGGVWTWKAGGQWRPIDGLRFSGMWQRAVRAPNVDELFTNPTTFTDEVDLDTDFCAASQDPAARGLAPVCIAQGMSPAAIGVYDPAPGSVFFTSIQSGNPDLGVERAGSITAGFEYTFDLPVALRIGADYFSIALDGAIAATFPFEQCPIVADPASEICSLITRDPSGEPISATYKPLNVAVARTKGVDLTLDFSAEAPRSLGLGEARFALRSAATYYFELGLQQNEGAPFVDCAGLYGPFCGLSFAGGGLNFDGITYPAQLVSTSFSLEKGPFVGSLRWRWMSGQRNADAAISEQNGFPPDPNTAIFSIPARHYVDLAGVFEIADSVRLRAGVDNVFKTRPPLLGSQQFQANTDPTRYDVFGRRFHIGVDVSFWRN
jgi:outer membrane receptor protein involved in Fe transport